MTFASFHSKGTTPAFNNKLNTLASGILTCSTVSNSSFAHLYKMNVFIIINLYGVYILRNLSSEAQQNRIIKHNHEQGRAKVIIRTRDNRRVMVEMQFGINMFLVFFFRKIAIVSDVW